MKCKKLNFWVYAFVCLMLVCYGCKDDDPETPPEGTYTKGWILNLNDYLGLSPGTGMPYDAAIIDRTRVLVSYNLGTTGSLVEINYIDGTVIRSTPTEEDSISLVESVDWVVMVHEQKDTKTYRFGHYKSDNANPVDFFAPLHAEQLSPIGGELRGVTADSYSFYTYGSIIKENKENVWVANWEPNGYQNWTRIVNEGITGTIDPSTLQVLLVSNSKVVVAAEMEHDGTKNVPYLSLSSSNGSVDWLRPILSTTPIRHMVENTATEWIYVFYTMGYSKIDHYGDGTFVNPMDEFANGTLVTTPLVIYSGKMFLAVNQGDDITLVSATDQETKWTEKYWEKTAKPLTLLATGQFEGVLVLSSTGFLTKYKENK